MISAGRAEIVAGRGAFVEAFPLFGLDTADHDDLFAENMNLLLKLRETTEITWNGRFRPTLDGQVSIRARTRSAYPSGWAWAGRCNPLLVTTHWACR
uniref:LLM class flavin-dependent oxidoreductase n=1 Tax=Roseovarius sp. BRH_c41 TaxID=1629709 RepID=UPI00345BDD1B